MALGFNEYICVEKHFPSGLYDAQTHPWHVHGGGLGGEAPARSLFTPIIHTYRGVNKGVN